MSAEIGRNPYDTEALNVAVTACDFDMASKKPQAGDARVFQIDIGFIDLAVITRNDVAQVMDVN
jgi:hypothetical protein